LTAAVLLQRNTRKKVMYIIRQSTLNKLHRYKFMFKHLSKLQLELRC
jgi:hypothetical protein